MFEKNIADKKIEIRVSEKDKEEIKKLAKDKSITEFIKSLIVAYRNNSNKAIDVSANYFTTRELTCLMQLVDYKIDRLGDLMDDKEMKELEIIRDKVNDLGLKFLEKE